MSTQLLMAAPARPEISCSKAGGRSGLRLLSLALRNPDPESVYFGAVTFARLGALEAALAQLGRADETGFFCAPALEQDRWLDPLSGDPRFEITVARARARCDQAARAFREAGGERLLGLA